MQQRILEQLGLPRLRPGEHEASEDACSPQASAGASAHAADAATTTREVTRLLTRRGAAVGEYLIPSSPDINEDAGIARVPETQPASPYASRAASAESPLLRCAESVATNAADITSRDTITSRGSITSPDICELDGYPLALERPWAEHTSDCAAAACNPGELLEAPASFHQKHLSDPAAVCAACDALLSETNCDRDRISAAARASLRRIVDSLSFAQGHSWREPVHRVCWVIHMTASRPEYRAAMLDARVVWRLVGILEASPPDAIMCACCCNALERLLENDLRATACAMQRAGGIPALLSALLLHHDHAAFVVSVCRVLALMMQASMGRDEVRAAGGVAALVGVLARHPEDPELVHASCIPLAALIEDDAARDLLGEIGAAGAEIFIRLLLQHASGDQPHVAATATRALFMLCERTACYAVVAEKLSILKLVQVLLQHAHARNVVEPICGILVYLYCLGQAVGSRCIPQYLYDARAVPLLVRSLQASFIHPQATSLQFATCICFLLATIAASQRMRSSIADAGGVPLLLEALEHHAHAPEVVKPVCTALRHLASCNDYLRAVVRPGGIARLVAVMTRFADDADIVIDVGAILSRLGEDLEHAKAICRARGVSAVLGALAQHAGDTDLVQFLYNTVGKLAKCSEFANDLVAAGAIAPLVGIMASHRDDADVIAEACCTFHILAMNARGFAALLQTGIFPLLAEAMSTHAENRVLAITACKMLSKFATDATARECIIQAGLVRPMVDLVARDVTGDPTSANAQALCLEAASHCLWGIALSFDGQAAILDVGALPVLMGILGRNAEATTIVHNVLRILYLLSCSADAAMESSTWKQYLAILGAALASNIEDADMVAMICSIMLSFSEPFMHENVDPCAAFVTMLPSLLDALRIHAHIPRAVKATLCILHLISNTSEVQATFAKSGGVPLLFSAFLNFVHVVDTAALIGRVLHRLCGHELVRACILDSGVIGHLFLALIYHPGCPDVIAACLAPLCAMAGESQAACQIASADGINAIFAVLDDHPNHSELVDIACYVLGTVANVEDLRRLIMRQGGVKVVMECLRRHRFNTVIVEHGCSALCSLLQDADGACCRSELQRQRADDFVRELHRRHGGESAPAGRAAWQLLNAIRDSTSLA